MRRGSIAGPLILITVGLLFLLDNAGLEIPIGAILHNGWPLILVVVGLVHMVRALLGRGRQQGGFSGGAIVFTVGVLFLLHQVLDIGLGFTWPVLLVVAGVLALLRAVGMPAALHRGGMRS